MKSFVIEGMIVCFSVKAEMPFLPLTLVISTNDKTGILSPHYTDAPVGIVEVIVNCILYSSECDELQQEEKKNL